MLLYVAIGHFTHNQLLMLKARLEVVVVIALIYLYAHRVIGWGLGEGWCVCVEGVFSVD